MAEHLLLYFALVAAQIGRIICGTIFGSCDGAISWQSTTGPFTAARYGSIVLAT